MSKRRQKEKVNALFEDEEVKATKEECQVAKFLIGHLPEKEGKLHGMPVKIFIGEEAVEALLSDAYRRSKIAKSVTISDVASATACLRNLMAKQLFHRAERVLKKRRDKEDALDKPPVATSRKKRKDDEKSGGSKTAKATTTPGDDSGAVGAANGSGDEPPPSEEKASADDVKLNGKSDDTKEVFPRSKKKDKKKRKIKLTMHEDQIFVNADEVYVWIYDPVRLKNVVGGIAMVVVTIVCCLFPLWPNVLKTGAYYVSIGGLGVVGLLVAVGVLRCLLFVLFWGLSFGNHHFWLFPNFSEDCGVIESFQPLYSYEIRSSKESDKAITTANENETAIEGKTKAE